MMRWKCALLVAFRFYGFETPEFLDCIAFFLTRKHCRMHLR
jgi:hypothetical protein